MTTNENGEAERERASAEDIENLRVFLTRDREDEGESWSRQVVLAVLDERDALLSELTWMREATAHLGRMPFVAVGFVGGTTFALTGENAGTWVEGWPTHEPIRQDDPMTMEAVASWLRGHYGDDEKLQAWYPHAREFLQAFGPVQPRPEPEPGAAMGRAIAEAEDRRSLRDHLEAVEAQRDALAAVIADAQAEAARLFGAADESSPTDPAGERSRELGSPLHAILTRVSPTGHTWPCDLYYTGNWRQDGTPFRPCTCGAIAPENEEEKD